MAVATNPRVTRSQRKVSGNLQALQMRATQLLKLELDFIPNPEFAGEERAENSVVEALLEGARDASSVPADLPSHLRGMCEVALLTQPEEAALFREMNLSKYLANVLRATLNPAAPDEAILDEAEALLNRAETMRDHIVKANMRLVISIVKKFVTPQHSFDDLLSNGIFTLMQTVEKFDFDRGFRFSTYAYRSISRNIYRTLVNAQKEEAKFTRDADDWAFEQPDDSSSTLTDAVWSNLREQTAAFLKQLDKRERLIIRSRYALGAHRKVRTFQYIADKLGISKERVRQLEQRAVSKLQAMADDLDTDSLFSAAMV